MDKENNKWDEISESSSDLSKKINKKFEEENIINDLKESFEETIENTSKILQSLTNTINSTINDEEIKRESKDIINKINIEIQGKLKEISGKFNQNNKVLFEEE